MGAKNKKSVLGNKKTSGKKEGGTKWEAVNMAEEKKKPLGMNISFIGLRGKVEAPITKLKKDKQECTGKI